MQQVLIFSSFKNFRHRCKRSIKRSTELTGAADVGERLNRAKCKFIRQREIPRSRNIRCADGRVAEGNVGDFTRNVDCAFERKPETMNRCLSTTLFLIFKRVLITENVNYRKYIRFLQETQFDFFYSAFYWMFQYAKLHISLDHLKPKTEC